MQLRRGAMVTVLLVISLLTQVAPAQAGPRPPYYLALGDSLSVGVQPDATGKNQMTMDGYPNQILAELKKTHGDLRLKQLGCAVTETTVEMLLGKSECKYDRHSQLGDALDFIRRNRVVLITIDIGANDTEPCATFAGIDDECLKKAFIKVAASLPPILAALRAAAGPDVPIIGMNYYNPFLAVWPFNQALAEEGAERQAAFNRLLGAIYGIFKIPVADVAQAFHSDNFDDPAPPPLDFLPLNVGLICAWTYMCVDPPQGPNIHANKSGYEVIAGEFLKLLLQP